MKLLNQRRDPGGFDDHRVYYDENLDKTVLFGRENYTSQNTQEFRLCIGAGRPTKTPLNEITAYYHLDNFEYGVMAQRWIDRGAPTLTIEHYNGYDEPDKRDTPERRMYTTALFSALGYLNGLHNRFAEIRFIIFIPDEPFIRTLNHPLVTDRNRIKNSATSAEFPIGHSLLMEIFTD